MLSVEPPTYLHIRIRSLKSGMGEAFLENGGDLVCGAIVSVRSAGDSPCIRCKLDNSPHPLKAACVSDDSHTWQEPRQQDCPVAFCGEGWVRSSVHESAVSLQDEKKVMALGRHYREAWTSGAVLWAHTLGPWFQPYPNPKPNDEGA